MVRWPPEILVSGDLSGSELLRVRLLIGDPVARRGEEPILAGATRLRDGGRVLEDRRGALPEGGPRQVEAAVPAARGLAADVTDAAEVAQVGPRPLRHEGVDS